MSAVGAWSNYNRIADEPKGRTHGRISCYQAGCHCDQCRETARLERAKYRARARARQGLAS